MRDAQDYIGIDKIVAAMILYSDVTHLSSNGRKKAHPVVMTLGNIAFPKRWGRPGHSLLALLPIPPSNMPSHLKVELYNACIAKLLEPLLRLKDNSGMVSAGRVSAGMVSAGRVSAGMVSAGRVSSGMVSAGRVSAGSCVTVWCWDGEFWEGEGGAMMGREEDVDE
ncbi:unnamed protein product [Closterium sp. NIES-54]